MSYPYAVVYFRKAKSWLGGEPRPTLTEARVFYSLDKAKKFQKEFVKPYPKIYKVVEKE